MFLQERWYMLMNQLYELPDSLLIESKKNYDFDAFFLPFHPFRTTMGWFKHSMKIEPADYQGFAYTAITTNVVNDHECILSEHDFSIN